MLSQLQTVVRHPAILRHYTPILLLSHMRANTSLLGHILGDNPRIEGYYELHIGYHSWRSLWRQKLIYFEQHKPKPGADRLFDKVLHNDHWVNISLFGQGKIIFALREPERSIRSIVNLYREIKPDETYATVEGAIDYYLGRLEQLQQLSDRSPVPFCYLDADALRTNTHQALAVLSSYLDLDIPLSPDYGSKPLTGTRRAGDCSAQITSGTVTSLTNDYSAIEVSADQLEPALTAYRQTREHLTSHPQLGATVALGAVA